MKFPVKSNIVDKHLCFPVVVKTLSGSQGAGVFLSMDKNSFDDLTQLIHSTNKTANIILQVEIRPRGVVAPYVSNRRKLINEKNACCRSLRIFGKAYRPRIEESRLLGAGSNS